MKEAFYVQTKEIHRRIQATKVTFIKVNSDIYSIKILCRILKLPRSSYYEALIHVPSKKEQNFLAFGEKVALEFYKSKGHYGAPKIYHSLLKQGISCSLKHVQRHMKRLELRSITVRKYKEYKSHSVVPSDEENLLKQDFTAEKPNQKWVTDITYINTCKDG